MPTLPSPANAADDTIRFGGTGNYQNLGDAVAWLRALDPRRVIDAGCGFGRWGFLLREFCDIWNCRERPADWQLHLTALEAHAPNIRAHHHFLYNAVVLGEAQRFFAQTQERWDLAILGDMVEHMPKEEGLRLYADAGRVARAVLTVLPLGTDWPQDDKYGNPYERHRSTWELGELEPLGLVRARLYRDYQGRRFVMAILSGEAAPPWLQRLHCVGGEDVEISR